MADTHAREQIADVKLALDETGQFLALDVAITSNLGAFLGPTTIIQSLAILVGLRVYNILPAMSVWMGVFSNTQSIGALSWRGSS